MTAADWQPIAAAAQASLEDLREVARACAARIRTTITEYEGVSDHELMLAVERNLPNMLVALRDRRRLSPSELHDFALTVEERAQNGIALDDYLQAVAVAEQELWDDVARRAGALDGDQRAEATLLRLACMNLVTRTTASAHRRIEMASVRADQERRAQALRRLLRGDLTAEEAHEQLARLGLSSEQEYVVVRGRSRSAVDVVKALESKGSAYALAGDDTVGLAPERPVVPAGATLGVAGPVPTSGLATALQQASLAFETAWALGLEGVHDLRGLRLRAAVQASPDIGQELRRTYLGPLAESGVLGEELLATTRTYLEAGSRRHVAASRLHLHVNTIGYRLNRFTELTGADLTDLVTLAELQWLFTDLDLRG